MMTTCDPHPPTADPRKLVGSWRRFGSLGPVYEVMAVQDQLANGDWMMRIRVLETGEEVGYKLTDLMDDPKET